VALYSQEDEQGKIVTTTVDVEIGKMYSAPDLVYGYDDSFQLYIGPTNISLLTNGDKSIGDNLFINYSNPKGGIRGGFSVFVLPDVDKIETDSFMDIKTDNFKQCVVYDFLLGSVGFHDKDDSILLNFVATKLDIKSKGETQLTVAVVWYNTREGYIVRFFDTITKDGGSHIDIENFVRSDYVIHLGKDAPGGIVYDENKNVVISQGNNIKVYTVSHGTIIGTNVIEALLVTEITFGQRGGLSFDYLTGLAFNSKGHLVVAESNRGRVYVLDYEKSLQAKHPVTISIINGLKSPRCVACTVYFGDKDVIAVADSEKIGFYFCYEDSTTEPQVIDIPTVEQDEQNGVTGAAAELRRKKFR
jgi:hypothetical protein